MDKQLYLFFDTETTGRPRNYDAPSSDIRNWPRLVQISWIVSDSSGIVISKENHIIKPNGFIIPEDVVKLHGITTERALKNGEQIEDVLHLFWTNVQNASYIIGHNVNFDENVVEAEFYRMGEKNNYFSLMHYICTMLASTDYCKILKESKITSPWKSKGYKWPQLSELYKKLFGRTIVDAHNSESDVQATFECFWKLKDLGVISGLEAERGIIPIPNEYSSAIGMQFTTFAFNFADYSGYGGATTDLKLTGIDWNLFMEGCDPQVLLFEYDNKVHLMNKGKGIPGSYDLKDFNSILLSFGEECYYFHCVYYNKEIIILRFDQSNNHILLSRKDIVFHTVEEIRGYLSNVRQKINLKREEKRERKAIEQENHIKALIEDICRTGVEVDDKRIESLKHKIDELSSYIGTEGAAIYQSYIDSAIKENQERKDKIAEELKKEQEERKRQEEAQQTIKKERYIKWKAVFAVSILFICIWSIALLLHLNDKWEQCDDMLGVSAFITFLSILPEIIGLFEKYKKALIASIIFTCLTIISCFVYNEDKIKFMNCFWTFSSGVEYSVDCFSLEKGDSYLSNTKYHIFDSQVKRFIKLKINSCNSIYELDDYLRNNSNGLYVEEAQRQINMLRHQAQTPED